MTRLVFRRLRSSPQYGNVPYLDFGRIFYDGVSSSKPRAGSKIGDLPVYVKSNAEGDPVSFTHHHHFPFRWQQYMTVGCNGRYSSLSLAFAHPPGYRHHGKPSRSSHPRDGDAGRICLPFERRRQVTLPSSYRSRRTSVIGTGSNPQRRQPTAEHSGECLCDLYQELPVATDAGECCKCPR